MRTPSHCITQLFSQGLHVGIPNHDLIKARKFDLTLQILLPSVAAQPRRFHGKRSSSQEAPKLLTTWKYIPPPPTSTTTTATTTTSTSTSTTTTTTTTATATATATAHYCLLLLLLLLLKQQPRPHPLPQSQQQQQQEQHQQR